MKIIPMIVMLMMAIALGEIFHQLNVGVVKQLHPKFFENTGVSKAPETSTENAVVSPTFKFDDGEHATKHSLASDPRMIEAWGVAAIFVAVFTLALFKCTPKVQDRNLATTRTSH